MQRNELKLQRKELEESREQFKRSADAQLEMTRLTRINNAVNKKPNFKT